LREMKRICEAHEVVFIADEVMTGWGRTGSLFACEKAQVTPDILCTSKGITGGFLPLAATLCQERIYAAHYSQDRSRTFFHSSSYTANPIACAAAFANTQVWANEPATQRIDAIAKAHARHLARLAEDSRFVNVRQSGTIAALDIRVDDKGYLSDIGSKLYHHFIDHGVLLRPLGNTVYILPPYCVDETDLKEIYDVISSAPDVLGL
ncbi:MAG: aminotransferase class III-fold pyridoxal phosphate-dependent enzyme, partial [Rhodospirillales bacterium]|nr:aminotransferase class III-fold pyridoxal phosphate-dependent enzyme [Rhodospirillales bacterium]